nr:TraB/VirB10 family protein [Aeromonas caviae]
MAINDIKAKLQNWWYLKDSKTRSAYTKYTAVALVISGLLWMYYGSRGAEPVQVEAQTSENNKVELPPKEALDADIREHVASQLDESRAQTKAMIADALKGVNMGTPTGFPGTPDTTDAAGSTPAPKPQSDNAAQAEETELGQTNGEAQPFSYPEAPASNQTDGGQAPGEQGPRFSYIGGISNEELPGNNDGALGGDAAKKSKSLIQLPVGFMRARLLVGVNALVGEFAQENPQTLMFRVQAPAQLPNSIKMNLRGCFSIANVHGNLSAERIFVLPVSMHCMTMDGKTIVEGPIKGFVSDKDGKRDMAAHVVSRAGSLLASAVFAKTVEGFANVAAQSGYETNTSALGSVQTLKSEDMAKTAVTQGLSGG